MFKNLEEKLKDLSIKFKQDLIDEINNKGHNRTGKLEDSIRFTFNTITDGYTIQLECLEYIKYLDKGKFLDDFLIKKEEELTRVVPEFITKDIIDQLDLL